MGKTANGLVRFSKRFEIIGVIDGTQSGRDAGSVLNGVMRGIPIYSSIEESLEKGVKPDWLIIGVATIGGFLPEDFRPVVSTALRSGIGIISGLHEKLGEASDFSALAREYGAEIWDIRKQPPFEELHHFANLARKMDALRIPILGMDGSIGKRTTGWLLHQALERASIKSVFVATGQTGMLQGADYGIPLDAIGGDFMVGELEHQIHLAYREKNPQMILIEGQGSISHPAYVCGTRAIITASSPSAVILQCAPGRKERSYHREELRLPMPRVEDEIELIEAFSKAKVIALTVNPEGLTESGLAEAVKDLESRFGLPVCDPLSQGCDGIVRKLEEMLP